MSGLKRVNRGAGHSYTVDGRPVPGVTTLLQGVPKNLTSWAAGTVAEYVLDRLSIVDGHVVADDVLDDLRETAATRKSRPVVIPDWRNQKRIPRSKLEWELKGLPFIQRDAAGNRGTEVHRLAQRLAEGEEIPVPEELVGHVDSYLRFRNEWGPFDEVVEFVGYNRTHWYAGTGDLLCRLRAAPELGLCLVDIKTNQNGPYPEAGLQLAGYRYFEFILDEYSVEVPMPEVDSTLCLWLRADGYDLIPFTAEQPELRMLLYAGQVKEFLEANPFAPDKQPPAWVRARPVKGETLAPRAVPA